MVSRTNRVLQLATLSACVTIWISGCVTSISSKDGSASRLSPGTRESGHQTLGDIVQQGETGQTPPSGDYYVTVFAKPAAAARIPDEKCVSSSLWAFMRKFVGIKKGATAILTATVTPTREPSQAITVPIFVTSASEVDKDTSKGSNCQTSFWDRGITYSFNSNFDPEFDVDLAYRFSSDTNVAVASTLKQAAELMDKVGTAAGAPAWAAKLADPKIQELSAKLEGELRGGSVRLDTENRF